MEFTETIKAYMEVGALGLFVVIAAVILILLVKTLIERFTKKDDSMESKFNTMIELLQKQNQDYQEQQTNLINNIVYGVVSHVPSPEENDKLTKISEQIDEQLQIILTKTNACRVSLVQYHNGGKGINKQSFLKMSMTNEIVALGVKPFITEFKDQFRSVLSYFVKEINDKNYCFIDNYEDMKLIDTSMYEFLRDRNIQAKYGIAVKNNSGTVIGFVCVEYTNKDVANKDDIIKILNEKELIFEYLLNS